MSFVMNMRSRSCGSRMFREAARSSISSMVQEREFAKPLNDELEAVFDVLRSLYQEQDWQW